MVKTAKCGAVLSQTKGEGNNCVGGGTQAIRWGAGVRESSNSASTWGKWGWSGRHKLS